MPVRISSQPDRRVVVTLGQLPCLAQQFVGFWRDQIEDSILRRRKLNAILDLIIILDFKSKYNNQDRAKRLPSHEN